ncbi:MAG: hypothetical protein ACK5NQ_15310 [Pseudomonas sp.]
MFTCAGNGGNLAVNTTFIRDYMQNGPTEDEWDSATKTTFIKAAANDQMIRPRREIAARGISSKYPLSG